jgi:hypothetical protein
MLSIGFGYEAAGLLLLETCASEEFTLPWHQPLRARKRSQRKTIPSG